MLSLSTARLSRAARPACAVAALLLPTAGLAGTGGPDASGYTWADSLSACSIARPEFGAGVETFAGLGAVRGPFDLPFTAPFHGALVQRAWVSPTGTVTFSDQGPPDASPVELVPGGGGPDDVIAAYWSSPDDVVVSVEATAESFHVAWDMTFASIQRRTDLVLEPTGDWRLILPSTLPATVTVGHRNAAGTVATTLYHAGAAGEVRDGLFWPTGAACIRAPDLLDCASATPAPCDAPVAGLLPVTAGPSASVYSCTPTPLAGHEVAFEVELAEAGPVSAWIDRPDLELLWMGGDCSERECLARAEAGSGRLDFGVLPPGRHLFVVDREAEGGGEAFTFHAECPGAATVACGETVSGTATGLSGRTEHPCAPARLDGPESVHELTLAVPGSFSATLSGVDPGPWVIAWDAAMTRCLSAGEGGAGLLDAPAGDYLLVVDAPAAAGRSYDLTVSCGEPVDCSAAELVSCTQVVSGDTSQEPNRWTAHACSALALAGGEGIHRFLNPVDQTVQFRFLQSQPGQELLVLSSCDPSSCLALGGDALTCQPLPRGEHLLVVDGPAGSEGPYEIEIRCSGTFPADSDLVPTALDVSALGGDCSDLRVDGVARVEVTNFGERAAPAPFAVSLFEDDLFAGRPGQWDPGIDRELGRASVTAPIGTGEIRWIDVPVAGTVSFRDPLLHAAADPDDVVAEGQEDNNVLDTGRACTVLGRPGALTLVEEWAWDASPVEPTFVHVDTVPLVGDVDGDATPDVVFVASDRGQGFVPGMVRAISGDGTRELWAATDPAARVHGSSQIALGDLDGDGLAEVVGQTAVTGDTLLAVDDDGTLIWTSTPLVGLPPFGAGGGGPSIADLDGDGSPEVVFGHNVLRADGTPFWTPEAGGTVGANGSDGSLSVVVDVDGDGVLDVVAGPTAYRWNPATGVGEILWSNPAVPDGFAAVGDFDADDAPEIAVTAEGDVYLLEGDTGALVWRQPIPRGGGGCLVGTVSGGPPTVADFDGDCQAEIGVSGADWYVVFEGDGSELWRAPIDDCSSHRTASSVFDFHADGSAEVVFMDQGTVHVFRGEDGAPLAAEPNTTHTWQEMPIVADVDGDGSAEIVVPANTTTPGVGFSGIRVFGDEDGRWVSARPTWNQHSYHLSNVCADGRVAGAGGCPPEEPSWLTHNSYRRQAGTDSLVRPDLTLAMAAEPISRPAASCLRDLDVEVVVGNGGGLPSLRGTWVRIHEGGPGGRELAALPVPPLAPGESLTLGATLPGLPASSVVLHAVVDAGPDGRGLIGECREDNNSCGRLVEPASRPVPVGTVLLATGHGDPNAPTASAEFDWSGDNGGLPRPDTEHYHLRRSTDPALLLPVPGTEPWAERRYTDASPAATRWPLVHYLRVLGADDCEIESTD